jgi:hypothetical protein
LHGTVRVHRDPIEAVGRALLHDGLDLGWTLPAIGKHDLGGGRPSRRLVGGERAVDIAFYCQRLRQRLGVEDSLRRAVRSHWVHGMRGIAEQGDAPEGPAVQRVAIDARVFVNRIRRPHDCRHVEPVEHPALEARQELLEIAAPVPVLAPERACRGAPDLSDPVD